MGEDTKRALEILERVRAHIILGQWSSAQAELSKLDDVIREQRGW